MRNSIYTTLGASNHVLDERQVDDYYATDPIAIDLLLNTGVELSNYLWECACGEGHLSKRLIELGYNVKSTDLIDRGFGEVGVDFFNVHQHFDGIIITNPPYKLAEQFIYHSMELSNHSFMFLKLQFLEGKSRQKLFNKHWLKTVYVSPSRIMCAKNGDFEGLKKSGGSAVAYAWYEFEKSYNGCPTIKWLKEEPVSNIRSLF